MRKLSLAAIVTLCCLFFASTYTRAQEWAKQRLEKSPRHQEWVDIKYGNRTVHAFVVYPEVKSKAPAVLVIHEIFGLSDWAREVADEKKLPAVSGKLAVTGFCWGGGQSFRFATNRHDLSAAFVFYGQPPQNLSAITAPVYGFYGGNDARIDATIPDTTEAMKKLGKTYEPVTYEGAGHGFMRAGEDPTRTENNEANVKARDEAWTRWKALLKGM
jgi:carboxymethylenebutenolidase